MAKPSEFYDLLLDFAASPALVREVIIGLVWTWCEGEAGGLAMSPAVPTRVLPWAGTLRGKPLKELAGWVREFEPYQATVGMAAINASINQKLVLPQGETLTAGNLAVFQHFLPLIQDKKSVVIGRYPGLEEFAKSNSLDLTVLERNPGPGDVSDTASEFLIPEAEWVFITASSISNKTFPRLAQLAVNASTVLMGPTTPWLPDLYHFGVDYLAGVEIVEQDQLRATVAEGGGVRLFEGGVRYRVCPLNAEAASAWTKAVIARTVAEKGLLTQSMETWYESGEKKRFPRYAELDGVNRALSRLDTCYKKIWDTHGS